MIIATIVKVPAMGDSISEGVIEEFVKRKFSFFHSNMYVLTFVSFLDPGDFVEADETIARIETDKVTVDITAP
jgi:pyruvate/2-oxoglutarate dehydrogenase complex dihydrolipoamide acyltransferase (E2) component